MVTLDRQIKMPGVMSVCLPQPSHPVSLSKKLTVAGWGANTTNTKAKTVTQLQYAELDTTPLPACQVGLPVFKPRVAKYFCSGEIQ